MEQERARHASIPAYVAVFEKVVLLLPAVFVIRFLRLRGTLAQHLHLSPQLSVFMLQSLHTPSQIFQLVPFRWLGSGYWWRDGSHIQLLSKRVFFRCESLVALAHCSLLFFQVLHGQ